MSKTIQPPEPFFSCESLNYVFRGAIAGMILSATFYFSPLMDEWKNETKSTAAENLATVKVDYYTKERELATKLGKLDKYNEKHELNEKLAIAEKDNAIKSKEHSIKTMDFVKSISKLILLVSFVLFISSGGFLLERICKRRFSTKKTIIEFTPEQRAKVENLLINSIKTTTNNPKTNQKHQEKLKEDKALLKMIKSTLKND